MSADGRASDGSVRSTIGTANASVFPEAVGDRAIKSSPASASGSASVWMRNGEWMLRAASTSATDAGTPSTRKVKSDKLFDSLRVRDLPTSKRPKEERRANLTGAAGLPLRAYTVASARHGSASSPVCAQR